MFGVRGVGGEGAWGRVRYCVVVRVNALPHLNALNRLAHMHASGVLPHQLQAREAHSSEPGSPLSHTSTLFLAPHTCRILEFFRTNFKSVKPYDHAKMLERLPFDLRSQVSDILYLPTIKVWGEVWGGMNMAWVVTGAQKQQGASWPPKALDGRLFTWAPDIPSV